MKEDSKIELPALDGQKEEFFFFVSPLENSPWLIKPGEQNPLRIHNAGVGVCTAGTATVMIGAKVHYLSKGQICVVAPESTLYIISRSPDFKGFIVAANASFIYHAIRYNIHPRVFFEKHPVISLEKEELAYMTDFYIFCIRLQRRSKHPYGIEIRKHLLVAFLFELLAVYDRTSIEKTPTGGRKHEHFESFMTLVRKNYKENRSVDFYAQKLCISSRYLNLICRELTEHSASECINEYTAMNIALLLITTNLSILELSEEFNFSNPSYFIRFFKQHEGITPLRFRRLKSRNKTSELSFTIVSDKGLDSPLNQ